MKKSLLLASLAVIGLAVVSADRAAAHMGATPASICTPFGTATWDWTGMLNPSTTTALNIDCAMPGSFSTPVFPNPPDYHFISTVTVQTVDKNGSAAVNCTVKVVDTYGATNFTGSSQNSATADPSALTWTANAAGFAYASCTIPVATGGGISTRSGLRGMYVYD